MSATGRTIGNYVLGSMLGHGGTSEVYAAEHRFLGDQVAVKLLRAHLADSDAATDAFLAEARRTRAIAHPNVVRVLDFGRDDGVLYLVMERIEGTSLAARLRSGPLDEATVRRLGAGIADGMAAAHALGIVHRDLKPANVMLARDQPKVVDFGIARPLDKAIATGPRMGTLAYMAPEQLVGNVVAPAIDVWALGVILFEALTGSLPFEPTGAAAPQLTGPPPRPSTRAPCSPALEALIVRCLDQDPARRPPAMAAIASELRGGEPDDRVTQPVDEPAVPAAATAPTAPPAPRGRRRWLPVAIGAGVVASALAIWQLGAASSAAEGSDPTAGLRARPAAADAPGPPERGPDAGVAVAETIDAAPLVRVELHSMPAGATILVAGKPHGRTPATVEVPVGTELELRRGGYRVAHVRAATAGPLDVQLVLVPPKKPAKRANQPPNKPCPMPPCEGLD